MFLPLVHQAWEVVVPWALAVLGVIVFVLILYWVTKRGEKKEEPSVPPIRVPVPVEAKLPFRVERSVTDEEAARAREELRLLDIEKDITSYALTRLYEAEAEGKITESERDKLVGRYRDELKRVESKVSQDEALIGLHELEKTQADLVKMFYGKFGEISQKIEEFRSRLGLVAREVKVPVTAVPTVEEKVKPARRVVAVEIPKPSKTKVEERIEEIRAEVLKELERLEQMETEG